MNNLEKIFYFDFLKKIDRYILINYPCIWHIKLPFIIFYSFFMSVFLFIMIFKFQYDLYSLYSSVTSFILLYPIFIIYIYYKRINFNLLKEFGEFTYKIILKEVIGYIVFILFMLLPYITVVITLNFKVKTLINENQLQHDNKIISEYYEFSKYFQNIQISFDNYMDEYSTIIVQNYSDSNKTDNNDSKILEKKYKKEFSTYLKNSNLKKELELNGLIFENFFFTENNRYKNKESIFQNYKTKYDRFLLDESHIDYSFLRKIVNFVNKDSNATMNDKIELINTAFAQNKIINNIFYINFSKSLIILYLSISFILFLSLLKSTDYNNFNLSLNKLWFDLLVVVSLVIYGYHSFYDLISVYGLFIQIGATIWLLQIKNLNDLENDIGRLYIPFLTYNTFVINYVFDFYDIIKFYYILILTFVSIIYYMITKYKLSILYAFPKYTVKNEN